MLKTFKTMIMLITIFAGAYFFNDYMKLKNECEMKDYQIQQLQEENEYYQEIIDDTASTKQMIEEENKQLKEECSELEALVNDLDSRVEELQNEAISHVCKTSSDKMLSHEQFLAGNDSDNDGDDQYDNEYGDSDKVYIDENGNIIYDDNHHSSYKNNNNSSSTGTGNYYIAKGNSYYHNSSDCKFLEGADTEKVSKSEAISRGKHMCNCIKY